MKRFLIIAIALSLPALAAEPPQLPPMGVDREIFGDKTPRNFFEARRKLTECRESLDSSLEAYRNLRGKMERLQAEGKPARLVDRAQTRMEKQRSRALDLVNKCGDCATRVKRLPPIQTAGYTANWYVSDGSCQLPVSREEAAKVFPRLRDSLLEMHAYTDPDTGVPALYDFVAVVDGEADESINRQDESPFNSFLAVGTGIRVFKWVAFSYHLTNEFEANDEFLHLRFSRIKAPRGFDRDVYKTWYSGHREKAVQLALRNAFGSWYVTRDGYLRYHTAGDFGPVAGQYGMEVAYGILLETINAVSERALEMLEEVSP